MNVVRLNLRHIAAAAITACAALALSHDAGMTARERTMKRLSTLARREKYRPTMAAVSGLPYRPPATGAPAEPPGPPFPGHSVATTTYDPHLRAVSLLLQRRGEQAVAVLEAVTKRVDTADAWSDLAAAHLTVAENRDSGEAALDSIAAANRALQRDPSHELARFNRVLALERLGLTEEAAADARVLQVAKPSSGWAIEAARITAPKSDRRATWKSASARLTEPSISQEEVNRIVQQHPEESRRLGESIALTEWAEGVRAGNVSAAHSALRIARLIGVALRHNSRERLLSDTTGHIDDVLASRDQQRLTMLVDGLHEYREGRLAYHGGDNGRAERHFRAAERLLSRAGSPMTLTARYYIGSVLFSQLQTRPALMMLDELADATKAQPGLRALRAQIGWERGFAHLGMGALSDAIAIFTESRREFELLHERANAARFGVFIASALEYLDDAEGAWRERAAALERLGELGDIDRRTMAVTAAADARIRRRHWRRARTLLAIGTRMAVRGGNQERLAYLLTRTCVTEAVSGARGEALIAARLARAAVTRIADPRARQRADANLHVAEATLHGDDRGLPGLSRAVDYYAEAAPALLPEILLLRARLHRRAIRNDDARRDLLRGIDVLEDHRAYVTDLSQRAAMFTAAKPLFDEAIADALARHDIGAAFALSERSRARAMLEGLQLTGVETQSALDAQAVQGDLAPDAGVVTFLVIERKTIAIVLRHDSITRIDLGPAGVIAEVAGRVKSAMVRSPESALAGAETLNDLVLRPLRDALRGVAVIAWIPDDSLRGVPFAALYDRQTRRFAVDDFISLDAPSASVAVAASRRAGVDAGASAASISGAAFDRKSFPHLYPLPLAESEVRDVAALRRGSTVLTGSAATPDAVLRLMSAHQVVHVAAHGVSGRTPADAAFVLRAGADGSALLAARRIAQQSFRSARVAVLTACRSATPGSRGDGPESLAWAFLQAGVPTVIATPWPVGDDVAARFAMTWHRALLSHSDPAAALRDTLRGSARHADGTPRSPADWASFTVIGGSTRLLRSERVPGPSKRTGQEERNGHEVEKTAEALMHHGVERVGRV